MQTLEMPAFGIREAARRLNTNRTTLYARVHSGSVAARRNAVTGKLEIEYQELYRLLKEQENRCQGQ